MFDKAIQKYFADKQDYATQQAKREGSTRRAFGNLLQETAKKARNWTLIEEDPMRLGAGKTIRLDGTLYSDAQLPYGYWEAKDSSDNLDKEIVSKLGKGYPRTNTIFEDTNRAVLYQHNDPVLTADLNDAKQIADLLKQFYAYNEPNFQGFEAAVLDFQERIPDLGQQLQAILSDAHKNNTPFKTAYTQFYDLCKQALNPNISREAVDEMLIQHLMTERLMRSVFNNPYFSRRNVIAAEVEKVIEALTSQSFNRDEFFRPIERFYMAIENTARTLQTFGQKQKFINTVYERFFQGYSVKVADTHGIVYTPQEIVDFMCAAVEEVLHTEFNLKLDDDEVVILDPATGTGNFIINLMNRIPKYSLEKVYKNQLFANEVMLLPYYVASLNIEHEYYELTGKYEPFDGLCFVDTLDMAEGAQLKMAFMTEKNTERVERQKKAAITVILGNPPYNVGQLNENDNNKNRKYEVIDKRIRDTYVKDSKATNKNSLYDSYVRFFRWATDRLGNSGGIVCFVSNNSFIETFAFDGMRKHLQDDFTRIYTIDLKGNVRRDSMREGFPIGEKHTVFGLAAMVGISITLLVRNPNHDNPKVFYSEVDWRATRQEKFAFLADAKSIGGIKWRDIVPDKKYNWLVPENATEFASFISMGSKQTKLAGSKEALSIFKTYSGGVKTNRDTMVYSFNEGDLKKTIEQFVEDYNTEVDRYKRVGKNTHVDDFVNYQKIKWSHGLKLNLHRGAYAQFDNSKLRESIYRPFCKRYLFFDRILNEAVYNIPYIFPNTDTELENRIIVVSDVAFRASKFSALMTNKIVDIHFCATSDSHQCFPFYVYDENGENRRENITEWALGQFRTQYHDDTITKWDIFYYVYGLLHHPEYRSRYADNLKRELPRLPFAPSFWAFSKAGKALADLHLNYESAKEYRLAWVENKNLQPNFRVEKMRLKSAHTNGNAGLQASAAHPTPDTSSTGLKPGVTEAPRSYKTYDSLVVNDYLTLRGIPAEAFDYRLGNRSALEWIVDQYQVKTDARSQITSDPNNPENERYIVELVGKVITVSVETVKIVNGLPTDFK